MPIIDHDPKLDRIADMIIDNFRKLFSRTNDLEWAIDYLKDDIIMQMEAYAENLLDEEINKLKKECD